MLPLMLRMYVGFLGDAGRPLHPRIKSEIATHFGYVCVELCDSNHVLAIDFTRVNAAENAPKRSISFHLKPGALEFL
jgi:hypothetical protein